MKVRIVVTLKPGVLDPQGKAVKGSLENLGFSGIKDVRVGKVIDIELEETDANSLEIKIKEMCDKLLVNPVIETYEWTLLG